MEQELVKKIRKMLPKITENREQFTESELVVVKAAFEAITGIRITGKMSNCGGRLCEDYKRSIVNYMKSYKHVSDKKPKKTKVKTPVDESEGNDRNELMAEALKISEAKKIKKPHYLSGEEKLRKYINDNK